MQMSSQVAHRRLLLANVGEVGDCRDHFQPMSLTWHANLCTLGSNDTSVLWWPTSAFFWRMWEGGATVENLCR